MSGIIHEQKIGPDVLKKLYKFSEEFVDSFTANLVTYYYVFQKIETKGQNIKAFNISGKSLSTATSSYENASEVLKKLVNDLHPVGSKLKFTYLENWMIDVNRKPSPMKQVLLETALDVFQSYEKLFMTIAAGQIPIYANAAAVKIVKYFVSPGATTIFNTKTLTDVIVNPKRAQKNVIQCALGSLLTDLLNISPDKKKNSEDKCFTSPAIWVNGGVYVSEKSKPKKFGHRRLFVTELGSIPDGYDKSDKFPLDYTYVLDPADKDIGLNLMQNHFRGREAQRQWSEKINGVKHRIKEEREYITSSFRLDVLEDLINVMDQIENISEKHEKDNDDEAGNAKPASTSGNKITNVTSTKIGTWNATF